METTEEQKQPEENQDQPILNAFEFIQSKYEPAKDFGDADLFFTNLDIVQSIREDTGLDASIMEVNNLMKQMGYKKEMMNEMKAVWLLKKIADADN